MKDMIKEMYGLLYGDMPAVTAEQNRMHQELEKIKRPLRERPDFEELEDICLEVSCCSQEYGFVSGFKSGVSFMIECFKDMK